MSSKNSLESNSPFVESIKCAYLEQLSRLDGLCDSWSCRRPIVALSGGPDSTALLLALNQFSSDLGAKVKACHINHKLRLEESEKDAQFVSQLCKSLDIELEIRELELGDKSPSEVKLRRARYEKLLDYAESVQSSIVLTGHTLDDQMETILFRLFRGTSQSGLTGIAELRKLSSESTIYLVRPMLKLTKIDCLKFLAESETTARQDASNLETHYDRNYIRHQIIPKIENRFGQWKKSIGRLQELIACEEDYFEEELSKLEQKVITRKDAEIISLNISALSSLHLALQRRLIARAMRMFKCEPSFERVAQVLELVKEEPKDSAVTLSVDLEVRRIKDSLDFKAIAEDFIDEKVDYLSRQSTMLRLPDVVGDKVSTSNIITWLNKSLRIRRWDQGDDWDFKFPKERELKTLVNLTGVQHPLEVRMRRPKDVIQPFGMQEKVKLKKYLHTHKGESVDKLPLFQQELRAAIVVADQNEVLWVPGFGMSERLRVKDRPTHSLELLDLSSGGPVIA